MMARPYAELWWGRESPDPVVFPLDLAQRAVLEPELRQMMQAATDGIVEFGLELNGPKRMVFWQVYRDDYDSAEALTKTTSYNYLRQPEVHGRIDRGFRTRVKVHELLHNIYMEYHDGNTLGHIAHTEGWSFHGSDRFTNPFPMWRSRAKPVVQFVAELPKAKVEAAREAFAEVYNDNACDEQHARTWMYMNRRTALTPAMVVGVTAVASLLRKGIDFADIGHMQPGEFLGYE